MRPEAFRKRFSKPEIRSNTSSNQYPVALGRVDGSHCLRSEDVDRSFLKGSGNVRAFGPDTLLMPHTTRQIPHRRLEPTERKVEIRRFIQALVSAEHGARKDVFLGVTKHRHTLNLRAARIRETQEFGDLIEGLASRIIPGLAKQSIVTPFGNMQQHGVAA
jgi:hypothetical protein